MTPLSLTTKILYNYFMENIYNKVLGWYRSKPWWVKILAFIVLALIALLYVVKLFLPSPTSVVPVATTGTVTPLFENLDNALDTSIEDAKKELLAKSETIRQTGIVATKRKELIQNATTMDELDALKAKYKL